MTKQEFLRDTNNGVAIVRISASDLYDHDGGVRHLNKADVKRLIKQMNLIDKVCGQIDRIIKRDKRKGAEYKEGEICKSPFVFPQNEDIMPDAVAYAESKKLEVYSKNVEGNRATYIFVREIGVKS